MKPSDHPQAAHLGYFSGKLTPTGDITLEEWNELQALRVRAKDRSLAYIVGLYSARKALEELLCLWLEVEDSPHKAATAAALRATAAVLTNLLPQLPPTKREG